MSMKYYTRRGDSGTTGIRGGERVPKTDIRIEANGTLDELNAYLGVVRSMGVDGEIDGMLKEVQQNLMIIMSRVATRSEERDTNPRVLSEKAVQDLECRMDELTANGGMSQDFVLPGGVPAAAFLHVARTVCRRAERELWRLDAVDAVEESVKCYINRLSDFLFTLARYVNCNTSEGGVTGGETWEKFFNTKK